MDGARRRMSIAAACYLMRKWPEIAVFGTDYATPDGTAIRIALARRAASIMIRSSIRFWLVGGAVGWTI